MACVMFKDDFIFLKRSKAVNSRRAYLFTLNEVKPRSRSNERVSLQNVFDVLDRVILRSTREHTSNILS